MDSTAYRWFGGEPMIVGGDGVTRELVRGALRDGRTSDPRVDRLVRDWLHRWRARRWLLLVSAAVALSAAAWTDDRTLAAVLAVGTVCMLLAGLAAERTHRRLRRYRGIATEDVPA